MFSFVRFSLAVSLFFKFQPFFSPEYSNTVSDVNFQLGTFKVSRLNVFWNTWMFIHENTSLTTSYFLWCFLQIFNMKKCVPYFSVVIISSDIWETKEKLRSKRIPIILSLPAFCSQNYHRERNTENYKSRCLVVKFWQKITMKWTEYNIGIRS